MPELFTASDLVREFDEKLQETAARIMGDSSSAMPNLPFLLVSLGKDSLDMTRAVCRRLTELWPRHQMELSIGMICVEAEKDENTFYYSEYSAEDDGLSVISPYEVSDKISRLFDTSAHFISADRLLIYYVLESTSFASPSDLDLWLSGCEMLKSAANLNTNDILEMLILFLNEDNAHQEAGKALRERVGQFARQMRGTEPVIALLSNRRSDNRLDRTWKHCERIAADMIAVSNSLDTEAVSGIFQSDLITASYARAEKPISDISIPCVDAIINHLSDYVTFEANVQMFHVDSDGFRERLGFTKSGSFVQVDRYVEQHIKEILSDDLLGVFPLSAPTKKAFDELLSLSTAEDFNEWSLGALQVYLELCVEDVIAQYGADGNTEMQRWRGQYRDQLVDTFNPAELILLSEQLATIRRETVQLDAPPSPMLPVLDYAERYLKYRFSSDTSIRENLLDVIASVGEQAAAYVRDWKRLKRSLNGLKWDDSPDREYFQSEIRTYFDKNDRQIRSAFRKIQSVDELRTFLYDLLGDILKQENLGHSITATLEDVGAIQIEQTLQKLIGEKVPTYLQTGFQLGTPLFSFILLKVNESNPESLYQNLRSSLSPKTRYYDTGIGNAAESLNIFRVEADQLA